MHRLIRKDQRNILVKLMITRLCCYDSCIIALAASLVAIESSKKIRAFGELYC